MDRAARPGPPADARPLPGQHRRAVPATCGTPRRGARARFAASASRRRPRSANTSSPTRSRRSSRSRRWASSRSTPGTRRRTRSSGRTGSCGTSIPGRTSPGGRRRRRRAWCATCSKTLGLEAWVKTTGGAGLHVVAPIVPSLDWSACLAFARAVGDAIVRTNPARYTTTFASADASGKILIDYLRNNRTNTSICAFSPRARAGRARVDADRVGRAAHAARAVDAADRSGAVRRVKSDPWADYWACAAADLEGRPRGGAADLMRKRREPPDNLALGCSTPIAPARTSATGVAHG